MALRNSRLDGSTSKPGSVAITVRAASTASVSETGLEFTFQMDSSEWESASSAELRVTAAGAESVSDGSTSAASGHVCSVCSEYFLGVAELRSQSVAHGVTSLPVPAVVGTAMSGNACATSGCAPAERASR